MRPLDLKHKKRCDETVESVAWLLYDIPDDFKTQKMCNKAVCKYPWLLQFVPDWFVIRQQAKFWNGYCIDDGYITWYEGYQKRKAQKAKIKEELLPITWHPDRVMDWCISEDEKRWWK